MGGGDGQLVTERLVVTRWARYGRRRLYLNTPDGTPVGWIDLVTGERALELPSLGAAFDAAVEELTSDPTLAYTPRRALAEY